MDVLNSLAKNITPSHEAWCRLMSLKIDFIPFKNIFKAKAHNNHNESDESEYPFSNEDPSSSEQKYGSALESESTCKSDSDPEKLNEGFVEEEAKAMFEPVLIPEQTAGQVVAASCENG